MKYLEKMTFGMDISLKISTCIGVINMTTPLL